MSSSSTCNSDITEQDQLLLVNSLLPEGVGLFKQKVVHSCLHVSGTMLAVGSDLGVYWIIDMSIRKLIREISENKVPLRVIRLHGRHTLVATGSEDGLLTIVNYQKPSIKQVTREKDQYSVTAIEWSLDGNQLLVGYKSGKILVFAIHFDKTLSIESSLLADIGSEIIQLSQRNQTLLISTLAKPVLLDMTTGQLTQVGSRDRKPGLYGGTFTSHSGALVIARPGLRLWIADESGKVQSTVKFKDVFSTSSLSPMPLFGGIATVTTPNDAWQFNQLRPWSDEWIVSYHGNTIWVLEPHTLSCKGVMTLGQHIIDFTTNERDLYMLLSGYQRPVIKLSMPSLNKQSPRLGHAKITPLSQAIVNVSDLLKDRPITVDKQNDIEKDKQTEISTLNLADEKQEHPLNDDVINKKVINDTLQVQNKEYKQEDDTKQNVSIKEETTNVVSTQAMPLAEENKEQEKEEEKEQVDSSLIIDIKDTPSIIISNDIEELKEREEKEIKAEEIVKTKEEKEKDEKEEDREVKNEEEKREEEQHGSRRVLEVVNTGIADLKGMLSQPLFTVMKKHHQETKPQEEESTEPVVPIIPLSSHEVARRAMMLQVRKDEANDDDDVAVRTVVSRKAKKTKRKTRRKNRHTPASSVHSSMDHLDQLTDADLLSSEQTVEESERMSLSPNPIQNEQDVQSESTTVPPIVKDDIPVTKDSVEITLEVENSEAVPSVDNNETRITLIAKDNSEVTTDNKDVLSKTSEDLPITNITQSTDTVTNISTDTNQTTDTTHQTTTSTNLTPPSVLPNKELSLIATPPIGIRGRAHAFNIDSEDTLFNPETVEEVLLWEQPGNTTPIISTKGSHPIKMISEDDNSVSITTSRDQSLINEGGRASHSHSVSSSYSLEDAANHPLGHSNSESDPEEGDYYKQKRRANESIVADDYYSLVGKLVDDSSRHLDELSAINTLTRESQLSPYHPIQEEGGRMRSGRIFLQSDNDEEDISEAHSADIWCPVPQPSNCSVECLCMSRTSLWLIDQRKTVYWTNPHTGGRDWQVMKKHMSQISTSSDGKIVWGIYHQQAYARYNICDTCPSGVEWRSITRKKIVPKNIKFVACDNNTVWAINTDGRVLQRKDVTADRPEGSVWTELLQSHQFVQISCCKNIVWAIDQSGQSFVREGITPDDPMGQKWTSIKSPSFVSISVMDTGVVWGISTNNKLWFRCGATPYEPSGGGPWWEVSVSTLGKLASSPSDSMWKVISFERSRSFLQSVASRVSAANTQQNLLIVASCSQSGVCMLTSDNQLHACWKLASGYNYEQICDDDIFNISIWTKVTASNEGVWVVRDDGELYCVTSTNQSERIQCQGVIDVLASSPSAIWVLSKGDIWSRQGITSTTPQGFSWEYIELGSHMTEFIIHLAIGSNVAWAIDSKGQVHFRFGIHPREPGTGMSPAWIEVVDPHTEYNFRSIAVSAEDWLVWAIDHENVTYVRKGVTSDFPVGMSWERVSGDLAMKITVSNDRVFVLTPSGQVLCRQGITQKNQAGNYWRRLPGIFVEISSNPSGELWLIDNRGSIKKQRGKVVSVCSVEEKQREKEALEEAVEVDEWEML